MKKLLLVLILVSFTNFIFAGIDDDIYDVRDFGENVGTGDKNVDTAALLKAISAADSADGGSVYIPENMTLIIKREIDISSNIRLFSIGKGATLKFSNYPNYYHYGRCINIKNQKDIIIESIEINCDELISKYPVTAIKIKAVNDSTTSRIRIRKCRIHKWKNLVNNDIAIHIRGDSAVDRCYGITIEDCSLKYFCRGIVIEGKVNSVSIHNNFFGEIKTGCLYVGCSGGDYCRRITFKRNNLSKIGGPGYSGYPIFLTTKGDTMKHNNIKVLDNNIYGNHTYFDPDSTYIDSLDKWVINYAGGNADMIAMYDCKNSFVRGNFVTGGGDIGICLWRSKRIIVTENIVSCNNTKGIAVYASDNCLIANNIVYNNCKYAQGLPPGYKRAGIFVHNYGKPPIHSTYNYIVGNRCYDDRADENKTQDYGIYVTKDNCHNHIGTNFLEGNKIAPIVICEPTTTRDYVISSGCVNCEK